MEAEKRLLAAFKAPCNKSDKILELISSVLTGTHKTYKYVLLTGLLAKATDNNVDPLALQAGAPLKGAYDARSLCHGVLVPFERNFLQNALGGSNEPFLNKPARFTHLSDKNAVRNGNDRETLNTLIYIFKNIKTSADAEQYLACSLKILIKRIREFSKIQDISCSFNPTLIDIYEFILKFIEKSYEGETCAIVVGTLEKIYYSGLKGDFTVAPHKVNQSGASSKGIGDIDIFENGSFCYAIEVKDKSFTVYDLEHSFNKIIEHKGSKGAFIYGSKASFDEKSIYSKLNEYEKRKFITLFLDIRTYSKIMLFKSNINDKSTFIKTLMETAVKINSKESVRVWIQELLTELHWK
jgi:hypothetical protein